jgi:neutral trehalase
MNDLLAKVHARLAEAMPDVDVPARFARHLNRLHHDLKHKAVRSHNNRRDLLNGYSYDVFYDWDAYFENCYLAHLGEARFCRNNVEAFLDEQLACGFISRSLGLDRMRQHFKPFLAQMVWLGVRQGIDPRWLRGRYLDRLAKYLDYWTWFCDHDRNGLSVWDSADHSGMDNQVSRAGEHFAQTREGVDLNVYIAREFDAIANLYERLDDHRTDAARAEARARREKINDLLWDDDAGFYFDRDERDERLVPVYSVAGLLPLWDAVAPPERAKRLVEEHLTNPDTFWLDWPVATWAKTEPDYYQMRRDHECTWRGACWVPTNYMVFQGLRRCGFDDLAGTLAYRTCEMALREDALREFYNAETGVGQGLSPFWGWSSLAFAMPLEFESGVDPTDLSPDAAPLTPLLCEAFNLPNPFDKPTVRPARPGVI